MNLSVPLADNPNFRAALEREFRDSDVYLKLNIYDNDVAMKIYFERFLHGKAKEFGKRVYFMNKGGRGGSYVFENDHELIMFKLTHL